MLIELKLLALIIIANGAPIIVGDVLGMRWNGPVDGGLRLRDGRALFGPAKTWRGLVSAFLFTVPCTLVFGLPVWAGVLISAGAMLGDLLSSFIKRRLAVAPSNQALGLDQVPESLLPLLALQSSFELSVLQIATLVLAFVVIELLLSRVLFKLHLRNRPY
jgi:CDP-2,3-bis-(O-geranylgeranyl)-sn-glycerol synthase